MEWLCPFLSLSLNVLSKWVKPTSLSCMYVICNCSLVCHLGGVVYPDSHEMLLLLHKYWPWLLFQHLWCPLSAPAVVHMPSARPGTPLSAVETAALILLLLNPEGSERTYLSTQTVEHCYSKECKGDLLSTIAGLQVLIQMIFFLWACCDMK